MFNWIVLIAFIFKFTYLEKYYAIDDCLALWLDHKQFQLTFIMFNIDVNKLNSLKIIIFCFCSILLYSSDSQQVYSNNSFRYTSLNETTKIEILTEINTFRNSYWIKNFIKKTNPSNSNFKRDNLKVLVNHIGHEFFLNTIVIFDFRFGIILWKLFWKTIHKAILIYKTIKCLSVKMYQMFRKQKYKILF